MNASSTCLNEGSPASSELFPDVFPHSTQNHKKNQTTTSPKNQQKKSPKQTNNNKREKKTNNKQITKTHLYCDFPRRKNYF